MTSMEARVCFICSKPSDYSCPKHEDVSFCSKAHQDLHTRGEICFPYKISHSPEIGRFLTASKRIERGEVIFQEIPGIVGPNPVLGSPICIACYKQVKPDTRCSCCGFPLCTESCRDHGIICDHLRAFQLTPRQLEDICSSSTLHTILPLKLILSKESNPPVYNSLLSLMDHRDSRLEDTEYMEGIQGPVLDPLIKALFSQKSRMNKEDIMRALGIVEVNSYEIFNATGSTGFRGLYCLTSLLSHDCTPNARPVMTQKDPYECRLIASRDIQTGEVININYVHPQKPNRIRKRILKENWYFECFCRRCGDDSEFGLHPDALRCACHLKGLLLPSSKGSYECNKCGQIKSLKYVEDLIEDLERRKGSIDRADVQSYLELLQRSSKVLSPNHYFLNALQRWIIPLYCRPLAVNPELQPTSEMLKEKLRLCENYLVSLDKIEPGLSKNRGKVLYEWAEASLRLGGKGNLASIGSALEESLACLSPEAAPSFEHRLSQAACHALKLVNEMMENKEDTYL